MRIIDALISGARAHALEILKFQEIAPVGLGDTLADILACGMIHASCGEHRDEHGRLDPGRTEPFVSNGFTRWHQGGVPRIRLSHGLAAKLAMTDPSGIDADEVKLPFPCFILEMPNPGGPIVLDEHGEVTDVVALLAFWYTDSSNRGTLGTFESLGELLAELHRVKSSVTWDKRFLHAILLDGSDTYEHTWSRMQDGIYLPERPAPVDAVSISAIGCRAAMLSLRIIINLALYLKYVDTQSLGGGGRTVNHDHGLQSLFYEIGNEVKLERPLRDAARAFCMSGKAHRKWKLDRRFIVRGHWKQQPCGQARSERRLVFVEPYWKGPADAPVLARVYTGGE